jgi:hypothetical protein
MPGCFERAVRARREAGMELVISGLLSIIIMETYAWMPRLSDRLLDAAVGRLRRRDQDRFREEWLAGLEILPNTFAKLFHIIGHFRAARGIAADSFRSELRALDHEIRKLAEQHVYMVEVFNQASVQLNCSGRRLAGRLDEICSATKDLPKDSPETVPSVGQSAETIEAFSRTLFSAHVRATEFRVERIEASYARLGDVKCLIENASARLDETHQELRRGASLDELDHLLSGIASELRNVRDILTGDDWGDDQAILESHRICTAVGCRPDCCRHSVWSFQQPDVPWPHHTSRISEGAHS